MRRGSITENPKLEWFWRKNSNGRHTYHVGAAHKLGPEENMERVHDKRAREQERMERVHDSLVWVVRMVQVHGKLVRDRLVLEGYKVREWQSSLQ